MQERITSQIFMKKHKQKLQTIAILFLLFVPMVVIGETVRIPNPLGEDMKNLEDLIHAIVSFIRNVALMIAPIIFIIAGLMYYFAGGDPEKAKTATNMIKWTLIGLTIILVANGITAVIKDIMGVEGDPYSLLTIITYLT